MAGLQIEFPEPALFRHELAVRIGDINYGNHLGHDALVSLLHEARAQLFRAFGLEEANIDGHGVILTELAVRYLAQAYFGQTLAIEIAVLEAGSRGCDMIHRVTDRDAGTPIALARVRLLFYDYESRRVVPIPESFRRIMTAKPR